MWGGSGDDTLRDNDGVNALDGGPGLDTINGVRETADVPVYQAESATVAGAKAASNHAGYTGTGFVDYVNTAGDYVEWSFDLSSGGTYVLDFRYANGSSSDRPLELAANGQIVQARLPFPPTGSWDAWNTSSATVTLPPNLLSIEPVATARHQLPQPSPT